MIIIVEKDIRNECLNICPRNHIIRVGSYLCKNMCKYFKNELIYNGKDAIICDYNDEKEVKNA